MLWDIEGNYKDGVRNRVYRARGMVEKLIALNLNILILDWWWLGAMVELVGK